MPEYIYKAMKASGEYVDGHMDVGSRAELIQRLQESGLFLVSDHAAPAVTPMEAVTPLETAPREPEAVEHLDDHVGGFPPVTLKQKISLILLLVSGILIGSWRAWVQQHPRQPIVNTAEELNHKLALVKAQMPREEIEKIFSKHHPGNPDPSKAWYFVPPNFVVEMSFEQNRLKAGGITIFTTSAPDGRAPRDINRS